MDANEPVVIRTTRNLAEAEVLKNVLESEGIRCELEGENQGSFVGVLDVRILVRAWDEDRARHVLAAHGNRHTGAFPEVKRSSRIRPTSQRKPV